MYAGRIREAAMYLKSLEIQGFKSFPDKIRLTYDKGLTAVVGPNGSGKSNIGDAIRWVLGEQSTKTLRGSKMEDVIFSGTVSRRPMGFAAVTLVIDNSEGTLEGYGDEISVTRKLYRSGDSEYRINGKSVRLKDINELFMDTGLGRDGYSIIGQGRIAEIVGAKSNERRDIFEEAAGISKFRYRKLEAERKLAAAEDNMARLNDIVSELEGRVEPLRIQSEKAQKFLVLAAEQKKLEISVWVEQLAGMQEKLKALGNSLLVSRTAYEDAERNLSEEEQKIQDCYRTMQQCSVEAEEARRLTAELRETASALNAEIAVLKNEIVHQEEAVRLSKQQHSEELQTQERLIGQLESAECAAEQAEKQCLATSEALEAAERAFRDKEAEFRREDERSRYADEQVHNLYLQKSEIQYELRTAEQKAELHRTELETQKRNTEENAARLKTAEQAYAEALQAVEQMEAARKLQEQNISGIQTRVQQLQQKCRSEEEKARQCGFQLREKKQRHRILSDMESHMEGFSGSVKTIMRMVQQGRMHGIFGTVAQLIQVDSQYGIAIETALGAAVQNLIVENEEAAKAGIRMLREQKAGRATFLPLTSIRGKYLNEQGLSGQSGFVAVASDLVTCDAAYRQIAESLLGRIVIAQDIDKGTEIAKRYSYRFKIVTLDGQVINAGGSFTGGSVQKNGGMLTRKTEISALQKEISALEEQCRQAEQQAAESSRAAAEAEQTLQTEIAVGTGLQEQHLRAQTEAERQAFPVSQYRRNAQELAEQMLLTKKQISLAEEEICQVKESFVQKEKEIAAAQAGRSGSQDRMSTMQAERERLSEQYSDLKIRLAQEEKDRDAARQTLAAIQEAVETADQRDSSFREELSARQAAIVRQKQEAEDKEVLLRQTEQKIHDTEEHGRAALQAHDAQNSRIREMQQGMNEFHAAKEKLSAEVTRLTERQTHIQEESDQIVSKLLEVYELTRSEAQEAAEPVEDMAAAKRSLAEVKQKIRSLGSVNVDAIEEYREVSERYRFLSAQMTDVRHSKRELEKLIEELTGEMCRIFTESFAVINRNFKEIFRDLFGGGTAELRLTEPENVLTSGIEINVAPPGKVIKNLISLSGGEQSFVAIAIYFAILRLRPAPFCILDEIDAALDEANVRKYAHYLKQFTDRTQFVLVTHRRSAMEEANVLYGVTMQADGISRLLRLEQPEDIPTEE